MGNLVCKELNSKMDVLSLCYLQAEAFILDHLLSNEC